MPSHIKKTRQCERRVPSGTVVHNARFAGTEWAENNAAQAKLARAAINVSCRNQR